MLAEAGSDLNACDTSGRTPLHWAVFANARRIVQYLLRLGKLRVDASIRDVCGYTPAQIARNRVRVSSSCKTRNPKGRALKGEGATGTRSFGTSIGFVRRG